MSSLKRARKDPKDTTDVTNITERNMSITVVILQERTSMATKGTPESIRRSIATEGTLDITRTEQKRASQRDMTIKTDDHVHKETQATFVENSVDLRSKGVDDVTEWIEKMMLGRECTVDGQTTTEEGGLREALRL